MSSSSSASSQCSLVSSAQSASSTVQFSCRLSQNRINRRSASVQQVSSGPPTVNDVICACVRPALAAKTLTCTPHSYSAPQDAVTRSMTISRCRMVRCPWSSSPELKNLKNSRRSRAIVVNNNSGGGAGAGGGAGGPGPWGGGGAGGGRGG